MGAITLTIITMMAYDNVVRLTSVFVKTCEVFYKSIIAMIGLDALVVSDFLAIVSYGGWFVMIGSRIIFQRKMRLSKDNAPWIKCPRVTSVF